MYYKSPTILADNVGNNSFSFDARVTHLGKAQITIPCIQEIHSLDQIELGKEIVFEEVDHQGTIRSCTGLQHIYKFTPQKSKLPNSPDIYIFDNHNHALYFWSNYVVTLQEGETPKVLHIDQHSDLKAPPHYFGGEKIPVEGDEPTDEDFLTKKDNLHDNELRRDYTNKVCNVGNFIMPFLKAFPFTSFEWIKSEQQLLAYQPNRSSYDKLILDIDLDFRAPEMNITNTRETISKVKVLLKEASLVTIATSPYFLNQADALGLLHELLT